MAYQITVKKLRRHIQRYEWRLERVDGGFLTVVKTGELILQVGQEIRTSGDGM
nr:hypothetical protein [Bifidobacterium dentium]